MTDKNTTSVNVSEDLSSIFSKLLKEKGESELTSEAVASELAELFPRIPRHVHDKVATMIIDKLRSPDEILQSIEIAQHNEMIELRRKEKLMTRKRRKKVKKGRRKLQHNKSSKKPRGKQ